MNIIQCKNFKYINTCVTIGKFDGIHIGHRKILDKVIEISKENDLKSVVFTFDFDYFKNRGVKRLNTKEEKRKILKQFGIDILIDYPFDNETKNMDPQEFSSIILKDKLDIKAIVVGENFHFGKDAKGDVNTLTELGQEFGFKVYALPLTLYEGSMVSSTRIREELMLGHKKQAEDMLFNVSLK